MRARLQDKFLSLSLASLSASLSHTSDVQDVAVEDVEALMQKTSVDTKKKVPKGKEAAKLTARQMLLKLLLHDFVKDTKPELIGQVGHCSWVYNG